MATPDLPDDDLLRSGDVDPNTLVTAGLVAELIIDLRRIATSVETFADALVRTDERVNELADLRRRNRIQAVALGVLGGALLLAMVALIVAVLVYGNRLTNIAEQNRANGQALRECATPSPQAGAELDDDDAVHECYEDALVRQGEAIATIVDTLRADVGDAILCAREADPAVCFRERVTARTTPEEPRR
jgi:hypothetical protein